MKKVTGWLMLAMLLIAGTAMAQPPAAFDLLSPADGFVFSTAPQLFDWEDSSDPDGGAAIEYIIQFDDDPGFGSPLFDDPGTDSEISFAYLNALDDNTTYYWRVIAEDDETDQTISSSVRTVIVDRAPNAFDLTGPGDGTLIGADEATLTWELTTDPGNDDIAYQVRYDDDGELSTDYDTQVAATNETTLTGLSFGTTYTWTVVAIDIVTGQTFADNGPFEFTTNQPPNTFNLTSPADGATITTGLSADLEWEDSEGDGDGSGAITFDLYYDTDSDPSNGTLVAGATSPHNLSGLTDGDTYWWYVIAEDDEGLTTQSSTFSFTINYDQPPAAFDLDTPADGITVTGTSQTVTWTASSDPDGGDPIDYRLEWSTNNAFPGGSTSSTTTTSLTADITGLADLSTYYWRVIAVDDENDETVSTTAFRSFDTDIPPGQVTLDSPADGADVFSDPVTLDWDGVSDPDGGAVNYKVEWDHDDSGSPDWAGAEYGSATVGATDYDAAGLDNLTVYAWRVTAIDNEANEGPVSLVRTFETGAPPNAFDLDSPADGSTVDVISPTVAWDATSDPDGGVVEYRVEWGITAGFPGNKTTATTTDTDYDLTGLVDDEEYTWRVIAVDDEDQETQSTQTWTLTPNVYPTTFVLIAPSGTFEAQPVGLSWNASTDPDGGDIDYLVEWDTNNPPSSGSGDYGSITVADEDYDIPAGLTPNTQYYWVVTAIDNEGFETEADAVFDFTTNSPPFAFDLDDAGSNADDGQVLVDELNPQVGWQATTDPDGGAIEYRVFYWPTSAPANVDSVTGIAGLSHTFALNALDDNVEYKWTVLAVDDESERTWADSEWTVEIENYPTAFALDTPVNGNEENVDPPTVSWLASSDPDGGTISYMVEWDDDPGFGDPSSSGSLSVLAYNINGLDDDTDYYWRVTASDDDGLSTVSTGAGDVYFHFLTSFPPSDFALVHPAPGGTHWEEEVTLRWEQSYDPGGTVVTYTVEMDTIPPLDFGDFVSWTLTDDDTTQFVTHLHHLYEYPWRITATDEMGETTESTPYPGEFLVDLSTNPFVDGWSLWTPALDADTPSIAGNLDNDIVGEYVVIGFEPDLGYYYPTEFTQGEAYWIAISHDQNSLVSVPGTEKFNTFSWDLGWGWDMLGYPFTYRSDLSNWTVSYEGNDYTMAEAASENLVIPAIHTSWATSNQDEIPFDGGTVAEPWDGFWFLVLNPEGVTLTIPQPIPEVGPTINALEEEQGSPAKGENAEAASLVSEDKDGDGEPEVATADPFDWHLHLVGAIDGVPQTAIRVGASWDATEGYDGFHDFLIAPDPPENRLVTLSMHKPDWLPDLGEDFISDIRAAYEPGELKSWVFTVQGTGMLTLSWPEYASEVPEGYTAVITDLQEGTAMNPAVLTQYSFLSDGSRQFQIRIEAGATGVNDDLFGVPDDFALHAAYPNPFNPSTTLRFDLPTPSDVRLRVYDVTGRRVTDLVDRSAPAGVHHVTWDASRVASGVYFVRMEAGDFNAVRKVMLIK